MINQTGNIFSANAVEANSVRNLEAEAHIRLFIRTFFEVNKNNVFNNLNAALDMGGSAIQNLYYELEKNGWTKDISNTLVIQSVNISSVKCTNTTSPFTIAANFSVLIEGEKKLTARYDITMNFTVRAGNGNNRTINNPHDMFIEDIEISQWNKNEY